MLQAKFIMPSSVRARAMPIERIALRRSALWAPKICSTRHLSRERIRLPSRSPAPSGLPARALRRTRLR